MEIDLTNIPQDFICSGNEKPLGCAYIGATKDGDQRFIFRYETHETNLWIANVIRSEEEMVWKSFDDLLDRTLKDISMRIQGIYGFEILTLELGEHIRNFRWDAFGELIVNYARSLSVGQERLIRYTSLLGILKKRVPETWGKIHCLAPIKIYRKPSEQIDLMIKRLIKATLPISGKHEVMLRDLSQVPLLRFGEEVQTHRLEKLLRIFRERGTLVPIFVKSSVGFVELGAQFGLSENV